MEWCSICLLIFCLSRSRTCSLWQKGPYVVVPSLQCDQICCVCTVKLSWAEFDQGARSLPLVCDTTVIKSMPRSSRASWNHWIYCECTITNLDVWSTADMSWNCLAAFMVVLSAAVLGLCGSRSSRWASSGEGHEWDKQKSSILSIVLKHWILFSFNSGTVYNDLRACVRREDVRNVNKRTFWVCCRPSYCSGYFNFTSLLFRSLAVKWSDESKFCMSWSLMNILRSAQKPFGEKGWG